jgi:hypothetical protein
MRLMERRRTWPSRSLSLLMLEDVFRVGMSLLARFVNLKPKNWSECVIFSLLMVVCWCFVGYIQDHIGSAS